MAEKFRKVGNVLYVVFNENNLQLGRNIRQIIYVEVMKAIKPGRRASLIHSAQGANGNCNNGLAGGPNTFLRDISPSDISEA